MRVSRMGLRLGVVALAWAVVAPSSPAAAGDISVRAGAYTDAEAAFVGIEYRTAVSGRLHAAPNFEIAFPSNGSLFSFNGDLHYVFPSKGKLIGWAGGDSASTSGTTRAKARTPASGRTSSEVWGCAATSSRTSS